MVHKKFTNEIDTTKNTQLIIIGKDRITGKMTPMVEYMPTKGTKTIMNYTYTLSIPYWNGQISVNETTSLNLEFAHDTFKEGNILYNNRKESLEFINNKSITEPGILFYTEKNNKVLNIKLYGYAYGDVNQISVVSTTEFGLTNDGILILITKFRTIINGKVNHTLYMIRGTVNDLSTNTTPINTSFKSNYLNYSLDKKEQLPYIITVGESPFHTIQSYIISNKIITKKDSQDLINKNKTYTVDYLKAAYGTYLTAQTILYFNDEICKYYGALNNVTFTRGDDIQLLVGVNYQGATYSNIYDPTLSISVINNPTKNQLIQFRFMTTLMVVEWERQAIRLSLQNVTSPLYTLYQDMGLNKNDVIFAIDNKTGILTIESTTNQSYLIQVDLTTGIVKVMMKTLEDELIKGAISKNTQGYCYHGERTDLITDNLNLFHNFGLNDFEKGVLSDLTDLAGSTLITAGILSLSSVAGIPAGAFMIIAGTGLCLANVGVDSLDDLFNPYYWADAAPSIMGGIWPGGYVGNFVKTAIKLRSIGQPFKIREKLAIRSGIVGAAPTGIDDYLGSIVSGKIISDTLKYFLRNIMHYPEGSYHPSKIRRLIV